MERTSIKDESNPSEGQVFIGNIALNALSSTTKNASEEVKFILTICGTIEVTKEEIKFNPPRYKEAIHELLDKQGIRSKIKSLLRGVQQKLISDKTPFSKDEQELIKTTRLPIGSLLTLLTQYKGPGASAALERYADLIAYEQVLQVVEEAAQDMLNKARAYSAVQISSGISELYVAQVEQVVRDLAALRSDQQAKMAEEQRALEFMLQLDHVLKAEEKGI
jgi:hypothetical protein